MKKLLINSAKVAVSVAILALLAYKVWSDYQQNPAEFQRLVADPPNWPLVAGAAAVILVAVLLTFARWCLLVRALGIDFSLREAVRLGFVGYLFNFTLSIVGGDVIKAVAIAHRSPGKRAAAASTVVVDRVLGLYALFVVGAIASLFVDFAALAADDRQKIQFTCRVIQVLTVGLTLGFALVLLPGLTTLPLWEALGRIPKVGPTLISLLESVRLYRRQPALLSATFAMSLGVHGLYSIAIYLLSRAIAGPDPSLAANFIIAPLSMVAKAAPVPGGLGTFEAAFVLLYRALSPPGVAAGQGFGIALAFRLIEIGVALIGAVYYFVDRREVKSLMAEAKAEAGASTSG